MATKGRKFTVIGEYKITGDDGNEVEPGGEVVLSDEQLIRTLTEAGHIKPATAAAKDAAKSAGA